MMPIHGLVRNEKRRVLKINMRIQRGGVKRRNQLAMVKLKNQLRESSRRLRVTDIRFDGTDGAEAGVGGRCAKRLQQSCKLDWIAERSSRPMRLDAAY